MKTYQKGFSLVEILVVIVVVGLIGVVGWRIYDMQNNTTPQPTTTQPITQQEVKKPSLNEEYLIVKEWGLQFRIPDDLTDVRYVINDDTAAFFAKPADSAVKYRTDYELFENDRAVYATGILYRSTDRTKQFTDEVREGKKLGEYFYYTDWAFSNLSTGAACLGLYGDGTPNCEQEAIAFKLVNQGDAALLNTIELAQ